MRSYEKIGAALREGIRDGRLPAGTVLQEAPLAELFRASRSPVRQALEALLGDGLLSRHDGRGLVVGDGRAAVLRQPPDPAALLGRPADDFQRVWAWQRLHDEVERILVRACVLGRFRVNEAELAAHYGIGRTVARDVLVRIQASGILDKTERAHWVTVPLDQTRVRHLYALRILLEGAALTEAAPAIPHPALSDMRRRLRDARATYPRVESGTLDRLEHDLHVACLRHAANRELLEALRRTRCIIVSSKHLLGTSVALPPDDPFIAEHAAVLDSLADGDAAAALAALRHHLESAREKVLHRLHVFREAGRLPAVSFVGAMPANYTDKYDHQES